MGPFQRIENSIGIIIETFKSIKKYPILLLPIFITWIIIVFLVIYMNYFFEFSENIWIFFIVYFLIFLFVTFVLSFSSGIMVEIVRQIETNGIVSFGEAFNKSLLNIQKLAGISLIWTFGWFILFIIQILLLKSKKAYPIIISSEKVAKTFGLNSSYFSWFDLLLKVPNDAIKIAVFLSIPAIFWKNKGVSSGIKEGLNVIGKHPVQFLGIYGSSLGIITLMILPLILITFLLDGGTESSDIFSVLFIIYGGVMFTFAIYMEQMTSALLFLWHLKWENQEVLKGERIKPMYKIPKPSLTDNIHEFN